MWELFEIKKDADQQAFQARGPPPFLISMVLLTSYRLLTILVNISSIEISLYREIHKQQTFSSLLLFLSKTAQKQYCLLKSGSFQKGGGTIVLFKPEPPFPFLDDYLGALSKSRRREPPPTFGKLRAPTFWLVWWGLPPLQF